MQWLAQAGFDIAVAARTIWGESPEEMRAGYDRVFNELGIPIDAGDPSRLVLFPEMRPEGNVPEITEQCWGILGKSPDSVMCASSRMVVKHKGADRPSVVTRRTTPGAVRERARRRSQASFGSSSARKTVGAACGARG